MSSIQQVIERYGAYSAALEREWIRSQQRVAVSPEVLKVPRRTVAANRERVAAFLRKFPQAWTVIDIARLVGIDQHKVYHALEFWRGQGRVVRQYAGRGHRGQPQRYQWKEQG